MNNSPRHHPFRTPFIIVVMTPLPHLDELARIIDIGGANFETRTLA